MGIVDINREALRAFEGPDGPIVMVNFFRLKDKTKFAEFLQSMRSVSEQVLQAVSGEAVYAGAIGGEFVAGEDHWDTVVLFRYPSWQSFCAALADDGSFDRARDVRREYLDDARFMLTTPLGGSIAVPVQA